VLVLAAAADSAAELTKSAEASAPRFRFSNPSRNTPKKLAKPSGRARCSCNWWWTKNGVPQEIKVVRSLGLGLDQKAIEAVQKWRFKPGLKDGKPVPVSANIEVNFRLL